MEPSFSTSVALVIAVVAAVFIVQTFKIVPQQNAWVVERQTGHRHSYAQALLAALDFLCERREALPPVACGLGEVGLLRVRLTRRSTPNARSGAVMRAR